MISAPGIGSGLDVNSIVSQLIALERRPIQLLDNQQAQFNAQLSGIGRLKSAISNFETAMAELADVEKFNVFSATSSDEEIFTATSDSGAASGNFDIDVTALAERHKIASDPLADSDTTTVGAAGDQLTVTVDGESLTVDIGGQTLDQIRDAINNSADNPGLTAAVLNEDLGSRLILTSAETGSANAIGLSTNNGGSPIADPLGLATTNAAADATVQIDGFDVTSASNSISDAIEGVTINLQQTGSATLALDRDIDAITESAQAFVDSYNELRDTVSSLRSNELAGDGTLLTLESGFLSIFNTAADSVSESFSYLAEIGVSFQKDGTLSLDSSQLGTALNTDFAGVAALFADSEQGFAVRLQDFAGQLQDSDGLLESRTEGINNRIDALEDRRASFERRLDSTEARLRAQYAALDTLVGEMQATSDFLTRQLGILGQS